MRYIYALIFLVFVSCTGINSANEDPNSQPNNPDVTQNEPTTFSFSMPEVIVTDSSYSISVSASDPDTLKSITLKQEFNDQADSKTYSLSSSKWDTTFSRKFSQTGQFKITLTATDRGSDPDTLSKSASAEVARATEQRSISFQLENSELQSAASGISVNIFNSRDSLIADGTTSSDGSFNFQAVVGEGSTYNINAHFSAVGYQDFSKDFATTGSKNYSLSVDPAPIQIESSLPALQPGESEIIDARDYITSSDPDNGDSITIQQVEVTNPSSNLTIQKQDKYTFKISANDMAVGSGESIKLSAETAYNSAAETVTVPIQQQAEITQIKDTITGQQGQDTQFQLSDYFQSDVPITSVDFSSSTVTITDLGNGTYQLSQPADLTGTQTISVTLTNENNYTLEAELAYKIESTNTGGTSDPGQLVIMPLGDSITNDSRSRVTLWNLLVNDGYSVDYVGDQYQESSIPDPDHEGVGGITIQGIMDKAQSLMVRHDPKYVCLMVGTNDIAWYFDETGQEIADRWNQLVGVLLDSSSPDTYVIAATIPPMSSKNVGKSGMAIQDRAVLTQKFNEALRQHVADRQAAGDNIVLADMEANMTVSEDVGGDGVHLTSAGYTIMGTLYYNAIVSILNNN